ncbi:imelysin family protein [Aquimarina hainanensis]|uniref:Imelysin family protein n=1 Tax=Aquimarina hainanensis TaxID=1578017 RepID=A0ABW5NCY3_9FLAO
MKLRIVLGIMIAAIAITCVNCNDDDDKGNNTSKVTKKQVIENYVNIVHQSYKDSYDKAVVMQTAINAFIAAPSEAGFEAAKKAWLDAREPYGQTEVYRESNGPIDTKESASEPWGLDIEGQINAWPLDEGYIDYVLAGTESYAGDYSGGIIADPAITINEALLIDKNEAQNDKSISTGWHAVEFLLWGQDNTKPADKKAGLRTYTDYTTAAHADRRKEFLQVSTDLLVKDLKSLVDTWAANGAYRKVFLALNEDVALKQVIKGSFFISGEELSSERMIAPLNSEEGIDNSGQEDEHSCFSDNTHRDIYNNALGVQNVIFGQYGSIKGASFYDLVNQTDADAAQKLKVAAADAISKINAIATNDKPFDLLIIEENFTDTPKGVVTLAIDALKEQANQISAAASSIGINVVN